MNIIASLDQLIPYLVATEKRSASTWASFLPILVGYQWYMLERAVLGAMYPW